MLPRCRKKLVALIALFAVAFAALMPATSAFARVLSGDAAVVLGSICTTHEVTDTAPPAHISDGGHCAFCTLGTPLIFAQRVDALLTTLDAPAALPHLYCNDALPRNTVAVHPLSPRAPPRAR
jgi:hypothetical protein